MQAALPRRPSQRARVKNLIAPLNYDEKGIRVDAQFIERIRQGFVNLADKDNVVVRFIGYSDDQPLIGRMARIYATHEGLSQARAKRVALVVEDALGLPSVAVTSEGRGTERPLGSNESVDGRAANRRVEVEFWYDDPLQELPDEPMLCPEDEGADIVTRVYDPPWGRLDDLQLDEGQPAIPEGYSDLLARAMNDLEGKANVRLRFTGFTRNERLERRTAAVYRDDVGLAESRARRAMQSVAESLGLGESEAEYHGRGYVHSDDVVNAGFIQGDTSHIRVEVVYDELAALDDYEGVDILRITREIEPQNPLALNLMRITVDGVPIDDPKRSSSDIQRCTDVALENADIQFGYDNMRSAPRLSVTATPPRVVVAPDTGDDVATALAATSFRMYTNYSHFIDRSEVRVFAANESTASTPLAIPCG